MSQRSFGAVGGSADCPGCRAVWRGAPAAVGLGPALFGTRSAADVADRTEDTEPRLLRARQRIYPSDGLGDRSILRAEFGSTQV